MSEMSAETVANANANEPDMKMSEKLFSKEIVWIVIGIIFVVVLICFLVWFLWHRKKVSNRIVKKDTKKDAKKFKGGGLYKDTYFLIDMDFPEIFTWEFVDFVADVYKKFFEKRGKELEYSYQEHKKSNSEKYDKATFKTHFNVMCETTLNNAFDASEKEKMNTFLEALLEDVRKCVYIHEHDHNIASLKRFADIDFEGANQETNYGKSQKKESKQMECQINRMIESINSIKKNDKSIANKAILKSYDMNTLETYLKHMKSSLKEMSEKTTGKTYVNSIKTNYNKLLELSYGNNPANYSQERMYKLSDFYQCFIDPICYNRNYNESKITDYHEALLNVCVNDVIDSVCDSFEISRPDSICVQNGEYIYQSDHIQKGTLLNVMGYSEQPNISDNLERAWFEGIGDNNNIRKKLENLTQSSNGTHDDVYPASLQRNVLFAVCVLLSIYQYEDAISNKKQDNIDFLFGNSNIIDKTCNILFKVRFKIFALNIFINSISKGSINAAKANSFEHSFKKPY